MARPPTRSADGSRRPHPRSRAPSETRRGATSGSGRRPARLLDARPPTTKRYSSCRSRARARAAPRASANRLDAGQLILLAKLLLGLDDRLLHFRAGEEAFLELVVVDVLLP